MKTEITCALCGKKSLNENSAINRAKREGNQLFCSRVCVSASRKIHRTEDEQKEIKRIYDKERRDRLGETLLQKKREYHARTYDPAKAAEYRKGRMHIHVEYCRRPEYREYKRKYDQEHRAKKHYGEFWECFLLSKEITDECYRHMSKREIDLQLKRIGKTTKRKRNANKTYSKQLEAGPLGNLELR